jgi:hypothetical protein
MRGNDLIMKNNLGSTKKIIIYRKKTKWILNLLN